MYLLDRWLHNTSDWLHHSSWTSLLRGFVVAVILGITVAMVSDITRPIFFG
jgi:hypothetical protein